MSFLSSSQNSSPEPFNDSETESVSRYFTLILTIICGVSPRVAQRISARWQYGGFLEMEQLPLSAYKAIFCPAIEDAGEGAELVEFLRL